VFSITFVRAAFGTRLRLERHSATPPALVNNIVPVSSLNPRTLTNIATMQDQIPHLENIDGNKQLTVNGKTFLMLAAGLQNSSLTSAEYVGRRRSSLGCWLRFGKLHRQRIIRLDWRHSISWQYHVERLDRLRRRYRRWGHVVKIKEQTL
jgi:hypothetical protein